MAQLDSPKRTAGGKPPVGNRRKTYSRRGVLFGAVSGGAAVAAARLLILERPEVLAQIGNGGLREALDPKDRRRNWNIVDAREQAQEQIVVVRKRGASAPFPTIAEPLLIAQLLRRFTFGFTDEQYRQALAQGYEKTVEQLLAAPPVQPPAFPNEDRAQGANLDEGRLQEWWIRHMITTTNPFAERMTLFLSGLLTSDVNKVELDNAFLIWQNRAWRDMALTDLRSMLIKASVDPAMLLYLDGDGSNGRAVPNQNYARELMELFSVGLVYSEQDVQNGAKALSGWRVPRPGEGRVGIFQPNRHFGRPVAVLGRQVTTLEQTVDACLGHPACAPFITTKFVQTFVTPTPDQGYVNRLATRFRNSGYQVKTLLRDLLLSPEFAAQANYRALVKSPLEFMVGAARTLGGPQELVPTIRSYAEQLGHAPFNPPDVAGWPTNVAWLSPLALMNRINFVTDAMNTLKVLPPSGIGVSRFLDGILSPGSREALADAATERERWWRILASPDAQLA